MSQANNNYRYLSNIEWMQEDLRRSGITNIPSNYEATEEGYRIHYRDPLDMTGMMKNKECSLTRNLYYRRGKKTMPFYRTKLRKPKKKKLPKHGEKKEVTIKYTQPARSGVHLYMPMALRKFQDELVETGNPQLEIYITEGEKKADAMSSRGYLCLGMGGIWNFKKKHEDSILDYLKPWRCASGGRQRTIYMIYDSDALEEGKDYMRTNFLNACARFSTYMRQSDFRLKTVVLPDVLETGKTGLDDWIVYHEAKGNDLDMEVEKLKKQATEWTTTLEETVRLAIDFGKIRESSIRAFVRKFSHTDDMEEINTTIRKVKADIESKALPPAKNKSVTLDISDIKLSEALRAKVNLFESIYWKLDNQSLTALSALEKLYHEASKNILNFPCGSGKTTGMILLSSCYANGNNRIWIVTEKVETVIELTSMLKALGADAIEWHGFNEKVCSQGYRYDDWMKEKRACFECKNKCTAFNRLRYRGKREKLIDSLAHSIVVTTHSHFLYAEATGYLRQGKVSRVYIDESPKAYEMSSFTPEALEWLYPFLDHEDKATLQAFIDELERETGKGDCKKIENVQARYWFNFRNYLSRFHEDDNMPSAVFRKILEISKLLKSYSLYAFKEGDSYTVGKGMLSFELTMPVTVLDGSALLSDIEWKGFSQVEVAQLKKTYSNTAIKVIYKTPSMKKLSDCPDLLEAIITEF